MKCYDELKAEMKEPELQMIETKRRQGSYALNDVQLIRKELGFAQKS